MDVGWDQLVLMCLLDGDDAFQWQPGELSRE